MGFSYIENGKRKFSPIAQFYQNTLNQAVLKTRTGATDYKTAAREAVKRMSQSGLRYVDYATGHRNRVDVAVRRSVLTGVNQMSLRSTDFLMGEMGAEYVEVTAHMGARPSHAEWQGRVYKWNK